MTEADEHDFSGEWQKADDGHYHICQNDGCTVEDTKVAHSGSTTCSGVYCDICNHKYDTATNPEYHKISFFDKTGKCLCGEVFEAAIDTTFYSNFNNAVYDLRNGATITLLANMTHPDAITILNKSVTLDLNGRSYNCNGNAFTVERDSDLTITDTSADKSGIITSTDAEGSYYTIHNYGIFNLEGGTIISKAPTNSTVFIEEGKFTMSGGVIKQLGKSTCVFLWENTIGVISGGEIAGSMYIKGNLTISGQTKITSTKPLEWVADKMDLSQAENADGWTIVPIWKSPMTAGVDIILPEGLELQVDTVPTSAVEKNVICTISHPHVGGTATCAGKAICDICSKPYGSAEKHNFVDGKCTACEAPVTATVTANGNTSYYATLADAIASVSNCVAEDNAVIKLMDNVDLSNNTFKIASGVFTIDLGGKTVTSIDYAFLIVGRDANVTFDNGSIESDFDCIAVYTGTANILNVTLKVKRDAGTAAYVYSEFYSDNPGKLYIDGATIISEGTGVSSSRNRARVEIKNSSIIGKINDITRVDAFLTLGEGVTFPGGLSSYEISLSIYLDNGVAYWQGEKMISLEAGQTEIIGDVTVKAICKHESPTYSEITNAQHKIVCSCGYETTESHKFDENDKCDCGTVEITDIEVIGNILGWNTDSEEILNAGVGDTSEGKTEWEKDDEIFIALTSEKYATRRAKLVYDGSNWTLSGELKYLDNDETLCITALYAPCYELKNGELSLKNGFQLGMTEHLEVKCAIIDGVLKVSFEEAQRTYSRIRIVCPVDVEKLYIYIPYFTPAGSETQGSGWEFNEYPFVVDENGNAYIYGTQGTKDQLGWINVEDWDDKDKVLLQYNFTEITEQNKSYVLDATNND